MRNSNFSSACLKRLFPAALLFSACFCFAFRAHGQKQRTYADEIESWHRNRVALLKDENGWLNLAGLFWLEEGLNTFGSMDSNRIVFPEPRFYGRAGSLERIGHTVILHAAPYTDIRLGGRPVQEAVVFSDSLSEPPYLYWEHLRWTIIRRDQKIGIRLRDLQASSLKNFTGIERYPVDPAWAVRARYSTTGAAQMIPITNVLGQTTAQRSPGRLSFAIGGKSYTLDALEEGEELFILFGDLTNGIDTYPSGRFLYAHKPDADGEVILDFNKSINPPCAFTPYATCPLPPPQNQLPLLVTAGEKSYHGY